MRKCLIVVMTIFQLKATGHTTSFVTLRRTIILNLVDHLQVMG